MDEESVPLTSVSKSRFISPPIRELVGPEIRFAENAKEVLTGKRNMSQIGEAPGCLSPDVQARPIVLSKDVASKIVRDHGDVVPENLILNANDWSFALKNVDNNPNKINLIKRVPDSENCLVLGANRDNGFYTVTHYEVVSKGGNELKSLLGRGDLIDRRVLPGASRLSSSSAIGGSSQKDDVPHIVSGGQDPASAKN